MTVVVSIVLAVLAIFAVAFPFFQPAKAEARRNRTSAGGGRAADAGGLASELESDLRTGIVSSDEYEELRQSYSGRGRAKSGATVPSGQPKANEDGIERRVRELRQKRGGQAQPGAAGGKPGQRSDRPAAVKLAQKSYVCPKCGHRYKQGDRFCTACGVRLTGGDR